MPPTDPVAVPGLTRRRSWPVTLIIGLATILVCETLLFVDVSMRSWAVVPYTELPQPTGVLQTLGRWVAVNMTPLSWVGFLFALDGLSTLLEAATPGGDKSVGSPFRRRPKRFLLCFLVSIPIWLFFDWVNFSFINAWQYHGVPDNIFHRNLDYFFAFGAISPAMFLVAELYQKLGLRRVRTDGLRIGVPIQILFVCVGVASIGFPLVASDPIGSLTLWVGVIFLLDPINHWLGAESIICDWRAGRWGRTLALSASGATCGLLWEFWNYWAAAKWTYNLPFLGMLEEYRYFEMPLVGFLGFLPFAIECWVVYQTVVFLVAKIGRRSLEPLPENDCIL